jgi:hypothetical protein
MNRLLTLALLALLVGACHRAPGRFFSRRPQVSYDFAGFDSFHKLLCNSYLRKKGWL